MIEVNLNKKKADFKKPRNSKLPVSLLQKARLTRIKLVKNASGQALFSKKKAHEARVEAFEHGLLTFEALKDEDIFEIQHHHLLQCLERATVRYYYCLRFDICLKMLLFVQEREFMEMDQFNSNGGSAFNKPSPGTPPLTPTYSDDKIFSEADSMGCCSCCVQVLRRKRARVIQKLAKFVTRFVHLCITFLDP